MNPVYPAASNLFIYHHYSVPAHVLTILAPLRHGLSSTVLKAPEYEHVLGVNESVMSELITNVRTYIFLNNIEDSVLWE